MPVETRLFVKASLLWLLAAFVLGGMLLTAKATGHLLTPSLGIVHAHMAFVGWLVNLVIGIALWLLPVNREAFPNNRGRYPIAAVRWCFSLLNAGLAVRLIAEPAIDRYGPAVLPSTALIVSALAQIAAIAIFAAIAWRRVRLP